MNKAEYNDKIRTGISVQMSARVTTAGTGLSSNENKSPVTKSFKPNDEMAKETGTFCHANNNPDATIAEGQPLSLPNTIPDGLVSNGDQLPVAQINDNSSPNNIQSSDNQEIINIAEETANDLITICDTNEDVHVGCITTAELDAVDSVIVEQKGLEATIIKSQPPSLRSTIPNDLVPHGEESSVAENNGHQSENQKAEKNSSASTTETDSQALSLPKKRTRNQRYRELQNAKKVIKRYAQTETGESDSERIAKRVAWANRIIAKYKDADTGGGLKSREQSLEETILDGLASKVEKSRVAQNIDHSSQANIQSSVNREKINTTDEKTNVPSTVCDANEVVSAGCNTTCKLDAVGSEMVANNNPDANITECQPLSLPNTIPDGLASHGAQFPMAQINDHQLSENQKIISIPENNSSASTTDSQAHSFPKKRKSNQRKRELQNAKKTLKRYAQTETDEGDPKRPDKRVVWANSIIAKYKNAEIGIGLKSMPEQSLEATIIPNGFASNVEKSPVAQNNDYSSEANIQSSENQEINTSQQINPSSASTNELDSVALVAQNPDQISPTIIQSSENQKIINTAEKNNLASTSNSQNLPTNRQLVSLPKRTRRKVLRNAKRTLHRYARLTNDGNSKVVAKRVALANSIIAKYNDVKIGSDFTSVPKLSLESTMPDGMAPHGYKSPDAQNSFASTSNRQLLSINQKTKSSPINIQSSHNQEIIPTNRNPRQALKHARQILMKSAETGTDDGHSKQFAESIEWANSIIAKYQCTEIGDDFTLVREQSVAAIIPANDLDADNGTTEPKRLKKPDRYNVMKDELKELGFTIQEIRLMKLAMDDHRSNYRSIKQITRNCEKTNTDPEIAKQLWLEQKEREKADKAERIATFKRKAMKRKMSALETSDDFNIPDVLEQNKEFNPQKKPPMFITPAILVGVEEKSWTFNRKGKRLKRSCNSYKYKVTLPNYSMTSDEFLKIVKKQNGLPTESWTLTCKKPWNNMFKAWYLLDQESHEYLKESKNNVYFLFGRIKLKFCEDN